MKIEIISVNALDEGAEILLTIKISDGEGRVQKKKLMLFTEQYIELGLSRRKEIDAETFDMIEEMSKKCRAVKKGSDLLSYSASSRVRLASRLRAKGIDKESANEAAELLQRLGAINERADVERLVQLGLKKLWGKKRIFTDITAKGYDRDIISDELNRIDSDIFAQNCRLLFVKKYKKMPDDPAEQKKIIAALMRYGYSFAEIKQAVNGK